MAILNDLSIKEETFCRAYIELMGNGTRAAVAAYDIDMDKKGWQNTAASIAKENLRKPHILKRVRELLDLVGMNDETVDAEVNFCLRQHDDLSAKLKAADIFNRIKGRYEKDNKQKEVSVTIQKFTDE